MGGKGSGRPPSIGTLIKRAAPQGIAVGTAPELVLPNFAGVKSEALRTSTVDITQTNVKGFVSHGATADTERPTGFTSVEWIGSIEPTNAVNGDTWIDTT